MSFFEKINKLDKRIIFLILALAVIIPLIFPLKVLPSISKPVRSVYDFIEKLSEGSNCVLCFDYYATTTVECEPAARAVARHLLSRNMKIVTYSLIPDGTTMSMRVMKEVGDDLGKTYGVDYAVLGYKTGTMIAIKSFDEDVYSTFPNDAYGKPVEELPIMKNFRNARDVAFLFTVADNASINYHIMMDFSEKHIPVAGSCTAVSAPELYPYLNSGQLLGLLGGLRGAAEYEVLINHPGIGIKCMDAQSIAHFTIAFLILISNVAYFMTFRKGKKK
ncbi:MAG: hypothetical protein M1269_12600 [Chloroflexi bacterium]|nr:hypothetical protein [Chloroflexota bacterium]